MTHSSYHETPEQAARAEAGSERIAAVTLGILVGALIKTWTSSKPKTAKG